MKSPEIAVIGLGYVGLPLATAFAKHFSVVGFDIVSSRVTELNSGLDKNNECTADQLNHKNIVFSDNLEDIRNAKVYIITVPTPVIALHNAHILILGITFKENCSDTRNTKVVDLVKELENFSCKVTIYDPLADKEEVKRKFNMQLVDKPDGKLFDALVLAVRHAQRAAQEVFSIPYHAYLSLTELDQIVAAL